VVWIMTGKGLILGLIGLGSSAFGGLYGNGAIIAAGLWVRALAPGSIPIASGRGGGGGVDAGRGCSDGYVARKASDAREPMACAPAGD